MRIVLLLASVIFLMGSSVAAAQGGPATRYVREQNERVNHILDRHVTTDAERASRDAEITRILVDILDFDELCRRALDTHWETLTPAQRTEFSSILRQLVERNYRANLERIRDYQIDYTREETTSNGVVVHMSARSRASRREPPVEMSYSMHLVGSDWRVFDVVTDSVSLVHNYQQQFHRIITRDGFDTLITRMRDRLAHETGSATSTSAASPTPTPPPTH
jgi:phospholipid transport system substrate-binding protein